MNFSVFFTTHRSTLGLLTLDVLVTENINLPTEVTMYPVEDGGNDVSDHITVKNEEITIAGSVSSSESFAFEFDFKNTKLIDTIASLREMHLARQTVKVVTGLGVYEDMAFTTLTINRSNSDKGGQWLDINATLRKIRKVALKETELPPDKAAESDKGKTGQTERRAGQAGAASQAPQQDRTAAASLFDAAMGR